MSDETNSAGNPSEDGAKWEPLGAIDRRVAGVLAEKAKTTPNGYPMSLNAICTASNQKSNRDPVMELEPDDVEESLERLRGLGAVGMIEGYGRVSKYRHYLYEWLGVDKVEMAVMAELLLRGAQTVGELRGRASRMEPIADQAALRPVLESLKQKGLVVGLTPEGRGHVVTHALYQSRELERVREQFGGAAPATAPHSAPAAPQPSTPATPAAAPVPAVAPQPEPIETQVIEAVRRDLDELRGQLAQLRSDVQELVQRQQRSEDDLREIRDALGG